MSSETDAIGLLKDSLSEAQSTVRDYDTKAQIVGVGYIFALGVVGRVGDLVSGSETQAGLLTIVISWVFVIVPIILFGYVLYPTRTSTKRFHIRASQPAKHILFYEPEPDTSIEDLKRSVIESEPLNEVAYELLKTTQLREIKRKRFLRALFMSGCAFLVLFVGQVISALSV